MTAIVLSPHNDDCELFACYSALRHEACVVVCLRSYFQADYGVTADEREAETDRAMHVLGLEWIQWPFPDVRPPWEQLEHEFGRLDEDCHPDVVFAPAVNFTMNGHAPDDEHRPLSGILHHDMVGHLAARVFGDRVRFYTTYYRWNGRERRGLPVIPELAWPTLKREALACYASQARLDATAKHFDGLDQTGGMDEWLLP